MNAPAFLNDPSLPAQKIAVIGSGISGASVAWALNHKHDVTLFESEKRFGGHTATVNIDYNGTPIAVDTGFIVYNTLNYPLLTKMFEYLGVETSASNMSFALSLDGGALEWSGDSLDTIFTQRKNIASPKFLWMLREILRFNRICIEDRNTGYAKDMTIGTYLEARKFSRSFKENYLIPMSAAIWSTPRVKMLDFPAKTFIDFFDNHRLISRNRPNWRTVTGGSQSYLDKLLEPLAGKTRLGTPVKAILRGKHSVTVTAEGCEPETFDHVVIATHTDQARAFVMDQSTAERTILSSVKYQPNRVILHRDAGLMPQNQKCWASWNYLRASNEGDNSEMSLTYWMNRLQGIDKKHPLFVSLNPQTEPKDGTVFGEWSYSHPVFDQAAIHAQTLLRKTNGSNRTWYAGAWTGYGFHEDGLRSGLDIAAQFHATAPFDDYSRQLTSGFNMRAKAEVPA